MSRTSTRSAAFGIGAFSILLGSAYYAVNNPEAIPGYDPAPVSEEPTTAIVPETTLFTAPTTAPDQPEVSVLSGASPKEQYDYDEVFIGSNGYAWPIGRPHRSLYLSGIEYTLPCEMPTCHHDHTAAIDIAYSDAGSHNPLRPENANQTGEDAIVGEPVRAITSGVIEVDSFQDIPGCQRIQLHADNGYYFWYGHVENAITPGGTSIEVETGQQIATVGRWDCVGSSQSPKSYAHGHIDMGCTTAEGPQRGGSDSCRDPQFVAIMNQLFAEMPA